MPDLDGVWQHTRLSWRQLVRSVRIASSVDATRAQKNSLQAGRLCRCRRGRPRSAHSVSEAQIDVSSRCCPIVSTAGVGAGVRAAGVLVVRTRTPGREGGAVALLERVEAPAAVI